MERGGLEPHTTALDTVRARALDRAFNAVKAARLLLARDHWEFAQPVVRQLFELLVNLEEIARADDSERAARRYLRFGMLQAARELLANIDYDVKTGRTSAECAEVAERFADMLQGFFAEFRQKSRKGQERWVESWCGRTLRQMATADTGLRATQHELVFRSASTQAHAAPGAITGWPKDMPADLEELANQLVDDNRRIPGCSRCHFFFEIWMHARSVLPSRRS